MNVKYKYKEKKKYFNLIYNQIPYFHYDEIHELNSLLIKILFFS
jgi:hypothetical protein